MEGGENEIARLVDDGMVGEMQLVYGKIIILFCLHYIDCIVKGTMHVVL